MNDLELRAMLLTLFSPFDLLFNTMFWFVPGLLITLSASMLCLTIGNVLNSSDNKLHQILKYTVYVFFLFYSLYNMGVLNNMLELETLEWVTIVFSIVAPFCMLIVGRQITGVTIKGYPIFNFITWWLIYVIISVVWFIFFPDQVNLLFVFIYMFLSWFFEIVFSKLITGA